mgnify:FL=1
MCTNCRIDWKQPGKSSIRPKNKCFPCSRLTLRQPKSSFQRKMLLIAAKMAHIQAKRATKSNTWLLMKTLMRHMKNLRIPPFQPVKRDICSLTSLRVALRPQKWSEMECRLQNLLLWPVDSRNMTGFSTMRRLRDNNQKICLAREILLDIQR